MRRITPDYSFERDGTPLAEWLRRLVADDPATRRAAGDVLLAMSMGLPSADTDWSDFAEAPDVPAQQSRFQNAVREAASSPGFDAAGFVLRLCAYRISLVSGHMHSLTLRSERDAKFDRIADEIARKLETAGSDAEKKRALSNLARLSAAYICGACDDDSCEVVEAMSNAGVAAAWITEALGPAWMGAPEALDILLDHARLRHGALKALANAGPAALPFAPRLIRELDAPSAPDNESRHHRFDGACALGAIGRDNNDVIDALLARLDHEAKDVCLGAVNALESMGVEVAGREKEVVERLRKLQIRSGEESWVIPALASVGRRLREMREYVLDMARPRPPQWRTDAGCPGYPLDLTTVERGYAIDAMRYLVDYADECLPVLIEAMTDFVEFDPDLCYDGPLARIAGVFAVFGAKAEAAAEPLARHLNDEPGDLPKGILRALAAMGPAARAAIPALEAFREMRADEEEPLADVNAGPIDEHDDMPGWTLQRIRGSSGG